MLSIIPRARTFFLDCSIRLSFSNFPSSFFVTFFSCDENNPLRASAPSLLANAACRIPAFRGLSPPPPLRIPLRLFPSLGYARDGSDPALDLSTMHDSALFPVPLTALWRAFFPPLPIHAPLFSPSRKPTVSLPMRLRDVFSTFVS